MGTYIELKLGGVTLDWSKNSLGADHGFLFQDADRTRRPSDQIDYSYYADNPNEDIGINEDAFVRPLARVLPRLDLLGHTLDAARAEYDALLEELAEYMDDEESRESWNPMTFDEFCSFANRYAISSLDDSGRPEEEDESRRKGRFVDDEDEIARIPSLDSSNLYWSEKSYFGSSVCVLSAYSMLQVLGQNRLNESVELVWQYGPIVDAGWVDLGELSPSARRNQTVLVATEGSTDARILVHAINVLCPDVADFFRFIDVNERHPFWGTGNLVKFAEGLVRIDVQNMVLFLLDNDAEGVDAYRRLSSLSLPANMRAMLLPDLEDFRTFRARGPEGVCICDINGRAAAIECYLDLNLAEYPPAQVLWSNYKQEADTWHGALEHKESYMKRFLAQTVEELRCGDYDMSKLREVIKSLLAETTALTFSASNQSGTTNS